MKRRWIERIVALLGCSEVEFNDVRRFWHCYGLSLPFPSNKWSCRSQSTYLPPDEISDQQETTQDSTQRRDCRIDAEVSSRWFLPFHFQPQQRQADDHEHQQDDPRGPFGKHHNRQGTLLWHHTYFSNLLQQPERVGSHQHRCACVGKDCNPQSGHANHGGHQKYRLEAQCHRHVLPDDGHGPP